VDTFAMLVRMVVAIRFVGPTRVVTRIREEPIE
jgi:hypothetical protein